MSAGRLARWLLALALVAVYGGRAATGIVGGRAFYRGTMRADDGYYARAIPYLERAVGGQDPAGLLWLRAEVREGLWELQTGERGRDAETDRLLVSAYLDYTEAIATSPAAGWYWVNLAEIYQRIELAERAVRPLPLDLVERGPWALIGRPGRVAIGLARRGVAREPNVFGLRDQLAMLYIDDGLDALALAAAAESARVQPMYGLHDFRYRDDLPPGLVDAFAEASRAALGHTPLLRRTVHLIALGRIELLRERYDQAERDLRAALEAPGHALNRAEAWYYLGVALIGQERWDEAVAALAEARTHPNLTAMALRRGVDIAEARKDPERALALLRELRRLEPRRLDHVLDFARVARALGRFEQAEDALRWGRIIAPGDLRSLVEMVATQIDRRDLPAANRALDELLRLDPQHPAGERLREQIRQAATARAPAAGAKPPGA